jgi:HPt (histidine-containing phosphotransfer) domain-containing protein/HAMP domain-containing protein
MNIRHRITLLVVLTFIAISLIGGFAVYQSRGSASEVKGVTQGVVPSALASAELIGQLKDIQLSVMLIVGAPDLKLAQLAQEKLLANQAVFQRALDRQSEQADSSAQKGLVTQAKESLNNYFSAIKDTTGFKLAGQSELAEANLAANVAGYLQEMEQIVETLQIEKRRSKDDAILTMNENLKNTAITIGVVTLVAVFGLSAIGLLLYRQIIHPITDMEEKMTEIAVSQDFTQRLSINRMDEIGHSAQAFNIMIEKIQESTQLVKQKTADIHALLHSIPQGILTVDTANRVHPEYSAYLESILETRDIAGRLLMDVVFSNTQCSTDILSQIETACSACIGEDAMNFEFNSHLFPREIVKKVANGQDKVLDMNWSPISDEAGTTLRMLLCIRDVTELRALELEATAQKRELAMIGEILAVQQEKFHSFVESSVHFLAENRTLLQDASTLLSADRRADTIGVLFRNMHTIKGNARTYGLLHLTHEVHDAEQSYDDLRNDVNRVADVTRLMHELENAQRALDEYSKLNQTTLGRKGPGRRADVEKFLMVERGHIDATRSILLEKSESDSVPVLRDALRQARYSLDLIGTEKVEEVIGAVLDSLPSLAKELGKLAPRIEIADNGIMVRNQIGDLMRNVFMHLYRNSLDHGIESAEHRMQAGKAPQGTIQLTLTMDSDQLLFRLYDDGRGLAVNRIRDKALNSGLISIDEHVSPEKIAQLIFAAGFSTATQVTEVSGRGVGMDAVRGFIEAQAGTIALVLPQASGGVEFRPFETVIRLPAKFAVAPILRLVQQVG